VDSNDHLRGSNYTPYMPNVGRCLPTWGPDGCLRLNKPAPTMGLLWGTMLGTPWPRPMNVHEMHMNTSMYHAQNTQDAQPSPMELCTHAHPMSIECRSKQIETLKAEMLHPILE
jgi:hypothetical protein